MTYSTWLTCLSFILPAFIGCGGKSFSEAGDSTSGGMNNGASRAGRGGAPSGRGGFETGGSSGSSAGGDAGASGTGGSSPGAGGSGASGAGGSAACTDRIVTTSTNNYSFSSILSFPPVSVQPNTELRFRWSEATEDILGHPLDPLADVGMVHVALFSLTHDELRTRIRDDALQASDLEAVMSLYTDEQRTEATLFELTSLAGVPLEPEAILPYFDADSFPPDEHTYTFAIASGRELGVGIRMIQGFRLDPTSTNTLVEVTGDSTELHYEVDLDVHERASIPTTTGDITLDWTSMTETATGAPFVASGVTEIVVARFDESVAELENEFLNLEFIAEQTWRADIVSGTTIALSSLTNAAGERFAGIDGNGTWLVALICGTCLNPAPWYLSVLTPCTLD